MLRLEHRMTPHGSLSAVIDGIRRSQTLANDPLRLRTDRGEALFGDVGAFGAREAEARAETRSGDTRFQFFVIHIFPFPPGSIAHRGAPRKPPPLFLAKYFRKC